MIHTDFSHAPQLGGSRRGLVIVFPPRHLEGLGLEPALLILRVRHVVALGLEVALGQACVQGVAPQSQRLGVQIAAHKVEGLPYAVAVNLGLLELALVPELPDEEVMTHVRQGVLGGRHTRERRHRRRRIK